MLTGQPLERVPPLGAQPVLPPRRPARPRARPGRHCVTEVLIEARDAGDGQVASAVWLAGTLLCQRQASLPPEVRACGARCGCHRWRPRIGWPMRGGGWPAMLLDDAAQGCWRRGGPAAAG